jgi:hypothetical protein
MLIKSRDPSAGSRSVARRRRRDRPTAAPSLGPNDPNDAIDAIDAIDRSEIREGALHPCDRS